MPALQLQAPIDGLNEVISSNEAKEPSIECEGNEIWSVNRRANANNRSRELFYLVTGYLRQNGFKEPIVCDDISGVNIVPYCDEITELIATKSTIDDFYIYALNGHRDTVQAQLVLIDQIGFEYLCKAGNGFNLVRICDESEFRKNMTASGLVKIDADVMAIEDIEVDFALFRRSVAAINGNSSSITDIKFIYYFIANLLRITRWKSSNDLKWFLKGIIA